VGNDLLYGASVEQILRWVETCLERLTGLGCRLAVATLPMNSVRRLGRIRYQLTKALFFPGSGPDWSAIRSAALELNDGLSLLAERHAASMAIPREEWYGFDPIHIRRAMRTAAWAELLGAWPAIEPGGVKPAGSPVSSVAVWRLRPAARTLCGRQQEFAQPALRLDDGTTISVY
jgi:hypothetical protein